MTIFDEIEVLYLAIDNPYAIEEGSARFKNYTKKAAHLARKRSLNDQAYFLFMFTRLEEKIRELSDNRISGRIARLGNWRDRRTWEILQRSGDRLSLLDRVSLLTTFNGADYQLIQRYKKQRDTIAHGGTATVVIDISIVLNDFKRLYNQFR